MSIILKNRNINSIALALACVITKASAQDFSSADIFSITEPITVLHATQEGGAMLLADPAGPVRFFSQRAFAATVGLETRLPKTATGFELDLHRSEARIELGHGSLVDKVTVIRFIPSFSFVDTEGTNALRTNRDGESFSPGVSLTVAPTNWNSRVTKEKPSEFGYTMSVIYNSAKSEDLPSSGAAIVTDTKLWVLNPTLDYSKNFAWGQSERRHEYRFGAGYALRLNDTRPSNAAAAKSRIGMGSISGRVRFVLDTAKLWTVTSATTYEFPIHETPAPGKAKSGDATVAQTLSLGRKFGTIAAVTLDYRHVLDDRSNDIDRYQVSFRATY